MFTLRENTSCTYFFKNVHCEGKKCTLLLPGFEPRFFSSVVQCSTTVPNVMKLSPSQSGNFPPKKIQVSKNKTQSEIIEVYINTFYWPLQNILYVIIKYRGLQNLRGIITSRPE